MSSIIRIIVLALLLFVTFGCGQKTFPDDQFTFSPKYRDLVNPYHKGDTLYFVKNNAAVIRIRITGVDSTISSNKGGLLSPRPHKDITVYCDNLDHHRPNAKDTTLVLINIYPDNNEQSCHFSLLNFRGWIEDKNDSLVSEFTPVPGRLFKNCFVVKNNASGLGEGSHDVENIYVQQTAGIVALKTYNGDCWLKR